MWVSSINLLQKSFNDFMTTYQQFLDLVASENRLCHISGEFNINVLATDSNNQSQEFVDVNFSHSYLPLIKKPTRILMCLLIISCTFLTIFMKTNIPLIKLKRSNRKSQPRSQWITPSLYRKFLRFPSDVNRFNFTKYTNSLTTILRSAKQAYFPHQKLHQKLH